MGDSIRLLLFPAKGVVGWRGIIHPARPEQEIERPAGMPSGIFEAKIFFRQQLDVLKIFSQQILQLFSIEAGVCAQFVFEAAANPI